MGKLQQFMTDSQKFYGIIIKDLFEIWKHEFYDKISNISIKFSLLSTVQHTSNINNLVNFYEDKFYI